MKMFIALIAIMLPASAFAANEVALTSAVFVEKLAPVGNGQTRVTLEEPKLVVPGDKLVFVLNYHNVGTKPATNFVVTNPMPQAVAYQGAGDTVAQVSVDGGKSWGALPVLRVHQPDGSLRAARPEDVTHVRWTMKTPIPVGAAGKLSFRGVVR